MKISEAIDILNINNFDSSNINKITLNELKKHYHIQCLIYHPDKNTENTTHLFQEINNAYNLIYALIIDNNNNNNNNNNNDDINSMNYKDLLINFINFIIKYYSNNNNIIYEDFHNELNNLKSNAYNHMQKILLNILDNFSINILEDLYLCLFKNKQENNSKINIENQNNDILNIIKKIIQEKLSNYNIYILTPNINNLLNNDVYKLELNNDIIYIPLWHNELNFENNIIKIDPILEDHIIIDDTNNIHYKYYNEFNIILDHIKNNIHDISIKIGDHKFNISLCKLKFVKYQTYIIKNKGLPKINTHNILDNSYKEDIILHIYLS